MNWENKIKKQNKNLKESDKCVVMRQKPKNSIPARKNQPNYIYLRYAIQKRAWFSIFSVPLIQIEKPVAKKRDNDSWKLWQAKEFQLFSLFGLHSPNGDICIGILFFNRMVQFSRNEFIFVCVFVYIENFIITSW